MIYDNLPAIIVLLPLIAAPICAMLPSRAFAWPFVCIIAFMAFIVALELAFSVSGGRAISYAMGNWAAPFGIEYRVDMLNAFILVIVTGVASIVSIYSYDSISNEIDEEKQPLFYSAFLLCLSGLLGITITNDAFNIYVFLEISSLATYVLIAMGRDRRALVAAFEYLVLGTIGATFILISIGLLYMMLGTLNISDLGARISPVEYSTPVKAALAFFVVGVCLKIAIFPLHLWLANSYTNAPSVVSSFLSATATKVGIYVLIRILFDVFGPRFSLDSMKLGPIIMTLSLFAVFVGSFVAIFQKNIKRMLAYSSIAQIGYIMLGISLASGAGIAASMVYLFNHAIAKAALFMAAGCVMHKTGGVRLSDFRGIARRMPVTMGVFLVAGLSLIGIPFTGGFVSKLYLLQAMVEQELWVVVGAVVVSSLLALVYIWRIIEVAYFQASPHKDNKVNEAPASMLVPMVIMTALVIVFGVYPAPVISFAAGISEHLFGVK